MGALRRRDAPRRPLRFHACAGQRPSCFCAQRPVAGAARCGNAGCARARSLDYTDRVADGLYDAWGVFPELVHVPHGETGYGLPSLEELRSLPAWPGDPREVRRCCAALPRFGAGLECGRRRGGGACEDSRVGFLSADMLSLCGDSSPPARPGDPQRGALTGRPIREQ